MRRQSPYLFPHGAHFGRDNLVLHAKGTRHVVEEFSGPLSIKTVLKGEVSWIADHRRLTLDNRGFLVLNDGQKYSMDIDALRPVETCCVFFKHGFVEQIAQDATTSVEASLSEPDRAAPH